MNSTSRPNIVLIHCHDLGTWLSCYGMRSVPSENLQRLADESVVFDAAFATARRCAHRLVHHCSPASCRTRTG